MKKIKNFKILGFIIVPFLILVVLLILFIINSNSNTNSEINYEKLALEHLKSILESATSEKENNSEYNSNEFLTSYLTDEGATVNNNTVSIDGYNFDIDRDTLTVYSSLGATSVNVLYEVTNYFTGKTSNGNKVVTTNLSFNSNIDIDKILFENLDGTITTDSVNASTYSKEIEMELDKDIAITVVTVDGKKTLSKLQETAEGKLDSLVNIARYAINKSGYYTVPVNGINYSIHAYVYDDDTIISTNTTFGDANDVATSSAYAKNMVLVKAKKNLTINAQVTAYGSTYGGPKGLFICCNGTLTNNSTISMSSRGAKAVGENVYLWKNQNNTYEYVPARGARYGSSAGVSTSKYNDNQSWFSYPYSAKGGNGTSGSNRQTGGGGGGAAYIKSKDTTSTSDYSGCAYAGSGDYGTSYSGGTGGGGAASALSSYSVSASSGNNNGRNGGNPAQQGSVYASGGAGNPDGTDNSNTTSNGTGGLLIIYGDSVINNGSFKSTGAKPGYTWYYSCSAGGGGSGGGSINVFFKDSIKKGSYDVSGGVGYSGATGTSGHAGSGYTYNVRADGGTGGSGTASFGSISSGTYVAY